MRFWPQTLFGRTLAVLLGGIVLTAAIFGAYQAMERRTLLATIGGWHGAERIADVISRLEETPAEQRPDVLRTFETPGFRITWTQEALLQPVTLDWQGRQVRQALEWFLEDVQSDQLRIQMTQYGEARRLFPRPPRVPRFSGDRMMSHGTLRERWHRDWLDMPHDSMMRPGDSAYRTSDSLPVLLIGYRLSDGTWLTLLTPPAPVRPFWVTQFFIPSVLALLVVLGLSVWAVRRSTNPLRRFTAAAERLGVDVNAPPMDETGPREVRRAAKAFNRMQRRLQAFVKDRTHMLAAISHDLRTPITRLRLRAEFIDDEIERDKMLADLEEMEAMISATLQFARDDVTAEPSEQVDLAEILTELCQDLADAGDDVDCSGPPHLIFVGRKVALKRMIANLIGNAVRYGERARVSLVKGDGEIVLSVDDDGPGIPEEMMERVFDPFVRVEGSRSRDTGGTGLGLTAVRSIVQAHGGYIVLTNRDGGGLNIRVTLPVAQTVGAGT